MTESYDIIIAPGNMNVGYGSTIEDTIFTQAGERPIDSIVITPAAENDLINIWLYIARDNQEAADRCYQAAEKTFETLAATRLFASAGFASLGKLDHVSTLCPVVRTIER